MARKVPKQLTEQKKRKKYPKKGKHLKKPIKNEKKKIQEMKIVRRKKPRAPDKYISWISLLKGLQKKKTSIFIEIQKHPPKDIEDTRAAIGSDTG